MASGPKNWKFSMQVAETTKQASIFSAAVEEMEQPWYAIYTKPRHEKKLAEYLSSLGIRHYLPLIQKKTRWSDRFKLIDFPVFPGYIFVSLDYLRKRKEALQHPAALSFIRNQQGPAEMSEYDVSNLKNFVQSCHDVLAEPIQGLKAGKEVKINSGPFAGIRGTIIRIKNAERLYVKIPMLSQMISTEVSLADIDFFELVSV